MDEFDFEAQTTAVEWAVEPLIPKGQLCLILAQAGVGKSLLVENLAVNSVYGLPFCGFKTIEGDVLLIDQDTPGDTLARRLLRFGQALGTEQKHKLFVKSMQGYSLHNGSLLSAIDNCPSANLVIIDCLHSVCGRLNPNYTSDMSLWSRLKEHCLNNGQRTILLNHHISEKWELTLEDLMQNDTHRLSMGNSAIIQQADSYYIIGARAKEGKTEMLYVRPVSKRVSIELSPLMLRIVETEQGEIIYYDGIYEPNLDQSEYDIITLFKEQKLERTVKEVYESMGHKHGEKAVRTALDSLEAKGKLLLSRHKANLFKYRLP